MRRVADQARLVVSGSLSRSSNRLAERSMQPAPRRVTQRKAAPRHTAPRTASSLIQAQPARDQRAHPFGSAAGSLRWPWIRSVKPRARPLRHQLDPLACHGREGARRHVPGVRPRSIQPCPNTAARGRTAAAPPGARCAWLTLRRPQRPGIRSLSGSSRRARRPPGRWWRPVRSWPAERAAEENGLRPRESWRWSSSCLFRSVECLPRGSGQSRGYDR